MRILGIETSCDETAVSVCEMTNGIVNMLSNTVVSQIDIHKAYGGVVPEVAARSHIEAILPTIDESLRTAFTVDTADDVWGKIDGIAVTYGAGLGGALLIGTLTAKTLALVKNKPLYAVSHVLGHVYANMITETPLDGYVLPDRQPEFPLLALVVSGKHCHIALFSDHFTYTVLGKTHDDAIGEAFDKVAKLTGLPYPGGPSIAKAATQGDPFAFSLPTPKMESAYDTSFSGLKTAVLRKAQMMCGHDHTLSSKDVPALLDSKQVNDIAAVFQRVAIASIVDKAKLAYEQYQPKDVIIAGGVASSRELRRQLSEALPIEPIYTDPKLCTDNGAMIASLGCFMAVLGMETTDPMVLEIAPSLQM
jgi:N6-L-threonylcarbamoyladenine synthase